MREGFKVKDSVNLPKTRFKMQANLALNEPLMLRLWDQMDIYELVLAKNAGGRPYVLHDGPPYSNGNIHLGHALNKILKDFIVKYKSMKGFYSPYVPGWDCHGLPIEKRMEEELGLKHKQMDILDFRARCREYAGQYVLVQKEQFKRLGVFGDWERPYLTMDFSYEAAINRAFGDFLESGNVYKGAKPVLWCISCRTALAEAEVEYGGHVSPSVFVKFQAREGFSRVDPQLEGRDVSVVIWTTTPWTLPANLAVAFHPDHYYVALDTPAGTLVVAEGLKDCFLEECGLGDARVVARFQGGAVEGLACRHPFIDRDSALVLADYVTLDQGTGCVHTAPGHGHEDYLTGLKYGLAALCPVDGGGVFTAEAGVFSGRGVFSANSEIVGLMRENGSLLKEAELGHSYPHCWRCHEPVIFRSTPQWFIALDVNGLREKALEAIKGTRWYPSWGEERITGMVANRPDWCISRQRYWGSPITVFYCEACGEALMNKGIALYVADIFEKEGADAWYGRPAGELLPPGTACVKCGGATFEKERDILDVWFDSGVSYLAVSTTRPGHGWPSDMYLEGGDQYRGWFHSSLLASIGCRGTAPYREVLTHGWVLDVDGLAMSKSRGNVVEPEEVIRDAGAEILRLWVGSVEYKEDVRISDEILSRLKEAYRKIRNTMRYMIANLLREKDAEVVNPARDPFNFDPERHSVPVDRMPPIDRWAVSRLAQVVEKCDRAYGEFNFHVVYHTVYHFCAVDMSALYFDIIKDRLYTSPVGSESRRSAQTVLWRVLENLVRLFAPILPFTTEEVWQVMKRVATLPGSVHLADFPRVAEAVDPAAMAEWDRIWAVREAVSKELEQHRRAGRLGNSLEAGVALEVSAEDAALLSQHADDLRFIFIVSSVTLRECADVKTGDPRVTVAKAGGGKCDRCWNFSEMVGAFADFPTVCERCVGTVRDLAAG